MAPHGLRLRLTLLPTGLQALVLLISPAFPQPTLTPVFSCTQAVLLIVAEPTGPNSGSSFIQQVLIQPGKAPGPASGHS